jgi:DNA-binding NarL/FixJ family response regulator
MDQARAIRVAVADDHPLYRDGVRTMIESLPGIALVGEAADTQSAIDLLGTVQPDVLLLDLDMPGGGGLEVLRHIREDELPVATLVLTMHEDDASLVAAIRAGAHGYLPKSAERRELGHAIETCAAGGVVVSARLSGRLAEILDRPPDPAAQAFPDLTPRERAILDRLARGEDNETIGRVLSISSKTVRNQVSTILNKLEAPDRATAIVRARDAGLGHDR